ncbi:MAG: hypothetical protein ACREHD_10695 [Pirellulales bacterium]
MQVQAVSQNGALVQLSEDDLLLIKNALNEVCHALDVQEFSTRMGADRIAAERLLTAVGALANQVEAAKVLPSSANR